MAGGDKGEVTEAARDLQEVQRGPRCPGECRDDTTELRMGSAHDLGPSLFSQHCIFFFWASNFGSWARIVVFSLGFVIMGSSGPSLVPGL
jgi:hypothetical protein